MAQDDGSFLAELSRRNVWRIGIAYVIAAWLILQVLETIASVAGAPEWVGKFVLGVLVVGLPVALILAWVYELTPEGIKREKDVARNASITHETGARLDKITIGVFLVAVAWIATDRLLLQRDAPPPSAPPVTEEIVATEITDKSIAVLPFMNMSEDASAGHFSDGLADTVLHKLAQIQSLRVVARNSSFQYRGQNVDVREVGEKLNVATVLEGSVQAAGNKIRVTAQLIDVANGYHLWSGNFDRELTDVFGIQDEIAEKVVDALHVSLGDEDSARLARRDTDNVDAFREYSLALREIDDYSFDSLDRALAHFDTATEIDPGYALAWAMKGLTWRHMSSIGSRTSEEYWAGARAPVERALELDPELPLAMALVAEIDYDNGKVDTALPLIERAVALAPNDPTVLGVYSSVLSDELRPFDAADVRLQALELDPLSIPAHQSAAFLLDSLDRDDEALAIIERMRVINPEAPAAYWMWSYFDANRGDWANALMSMLEAHRLDPSDPIAAYDVAWYYLDMGLEEEAAAWVRKSQEINPSHPAALASLFVLRLGDENYDEDMVRTARRLLIDGVSRANGARGLAALVMERDAYRTGYFDEYLAWVRHYLPELFDPTVDNVDGYAGAAISVGFTLQETGEDEHGRRLVKLAMERMQAFRDAYRRPAIYNDFEFAARGGDRAAAIAALEDLALDTSSETRSDVLIDHHAPWVRPYHDEPAYQAMIAAQEQRAAEQRALLLEMNDGAYPLPE